MHAEGGGAIELQEAVDLKEVVMAADLHRPVARIGDHHGDPAPPRVNLNFAFGGKHFAGNASGGLHRLGSGSDRIVDGDQLGPVVETALHLDNWRHLGYAGQDVIRGQESRAEADQLRDRLPVAGAFKDFVGDIGNRLGLIQLEAARPPLAGEFRGAKDCQTLHLRRCE